MADISSCSGISRRAKTILNMVTEKSSTFTNTDQKKNTEAVNIEKKQKKTKPALEDYVKSLYARPYSLTSSVFETFCETQITYNSHHSSNLKNITNILNEAFPEEQNVDTSKLETSTFQSQKGSTNPDKKQIDIACNEVMPLESIDLTCNEVMPSESLTCDELILSESMSLAGNEVMLFDKHSFYNDIELIVNCSTTENPSTLQLNLDFDSDDSVRDKSYYPSNSSDDSQDDFQAVRPNRVKYRVSQNKSSKKISARYVSPANATRSFTSDLINTVPFLEKCKNLQQKRRSSFEINRTEKAVPALSRKRRNTIDVGANLTSSIIEDGSGTHSLEPETSAPPRKRKKYNTSSLQRRLDAKNKRKLEHCVKTGCNENCLKNCSSQLNQQERKVINKLYWDMSWPEQNSFVQSHTSVAVPKRKTTTEPKRKPKRAFTLKKLDGTRVEVCKIFFLTTLGYLKTNDRILHNTCIDPTTDKRGKHQKTPLFDRDLLTQHVESFNPSEPHYRREHAPLRRYLPSDINVAHMHKHFCEKYPDKKVSYELYRKHVKKLNISFTRLGNEECEICEGYNLHKKETSHDSNNQIVADCTICVEWAKHHEKYKKARELYNEHKKIPQNNSQVYFSADLEKVIMLPRLDSFKAAIFCQRLVSFNQTFAPLGKITSESKPLTVLWHDGIAGRKQEDIMSAFYHFFICHRDIASINLWLDNCSAQNKNWLLYALLVHLINSELISTEQITLYYFEPGHTFMSSDQVHHQVELAMKKKVKLYDFTDFEDAVASINNSKVIVKSMSTVNFLNVPNYVSDRRVQNSSPRAYLKNMSQVRFTRKDYDLQYKNNFDDQYILLRFLNDKYIKNPNIMKLEFRSEPKGIDSKRKTDIIEKLSSIIPPHKQLFWKNLPTTTNENASTSDTRSKKRLQN